MLLPGALSSEDLRYLQWYEKDDKLVYVMKTSAGELYVDEEASAAIAMLMDSDASTEAERWLHVIHDAPKALEAFRNLEPHGWVQSKHISDADSSWALTDLGKRNIVVCYKLRDPSTVLKVRSIETKDMCTWELLQSLLSEEWVFEVFDGPKHSLLKLPAYVHGRDPQMAKVLFVFLFFVFKICIGFCFCFY